MLKTKILLIKIAAILVPILLVIGVSRLFLPQAAEQYAHQKFGGEAIRHSSENFEIFMRDVPLEAKEIAGISEEFLQAFNNHFANRLDFNGLDDKIKIFLFGNRAEFDEYYEREFLETLPHNAAFYNPVNGSIVMYWTEKEEVVRTLYHELTHVIMDLGLHTYDPQWSPWLSEGFATYIEYQKVRENRFVSPLPPPQIIAIIQKAVKQNRFVPLEDLCDASRQAFGSSENYLYYYESYLLVYFLLESPKQEYAEHFFSYFALEKITGPCPSSYFWNLLQTTPAELERELKKFYQL